MLEECGEAIQEIGKAMRHGLESRDPTDPLARTNRENIQKEAGHIAAAVRIMVHLGILNQAEISRACVEKLSRVGEYLHHIEVNENHAGCFIASVKVVH